MKSHRGTSLKKHIRRIRTGAAKEYPQALPQGQWDRSEDYRKATRATRNQEAAIRLRPAPLLEIWLNSDYFPKERAVSTGRCNTGLESTSWSFKVQSLARSLIEAQGYFVEVGLGVAGQVGFLGKYCRNRPLVFSLVPRCQGLCGSQK